MTSLVDFNENKRNIFHEKINSFIHQKYLWEVLSSSGQGKNPPLLLLPPLSLLVPITKLNNKLPWHFLNSLTGAQVRGGWLSLMRFLFDGKSDSFSSLFPSLGVHRHWHLNGCLVAVIAETGLGHFRAPSTPAFLFLMLRKIKYLENWT